VKNATFGLGGTPHQWSRTLRGSNPAGRRGGPFWRVAPCSFRQPRKSAVLRCAAPPSG
jgi:hypothetical protein